MKICRLENNFPMATVVYLCPRTGLKVQGLITEEPTEGVTSVAVDCPICNSIHLVKPVTSKTRILKKGVQS